LSALIEVTRVATAVGTVNSLLYMGTVTVIALAAALSRDTRRRAAAQRTLQILLRRRDGGKDSSGIGQAHHLVPLTNVSPAANERGRAGQVTGIDDRNVGLLVATPPDDASAHCHLTGFVATRTSLS
jgi:hypothetical protein